MSTKEYYKQYDENRREGRKERYKDNREQEIERSRQWRKVYPEKVRQYRLKHRYGLSHEDWLEMWESQGGKCAICNTPFNKPSDACIDHNHKTGEKRSLLCRKCNPAIGFFGDNLELMKEGIRYLERWEKKDDIL